MPVGPSTSRTSDVSTPQPSSAARSLRRGGVEQPSGQAARLLLRRQRRCGAGKLTWAPARRAPAAPRAACGSPGAPPPPPGCLPTNGGQTSDEGRQPTSERRAPHLATGVHGHGPRRQGLPRERHPLQGVDQVGVQAAHHDGVRGHFAQGWPGRLQPRPDGEVDGRRQTRIAQAGWGAPRRPHLVPARCRCPPRSKPAFCAIWPPPRPPLCLCDRLDRHQGARGANGGRPWVRGHHADNQWHMASSAAACRQEFDAWIARHARGGRAPRRHVSGRWLPAAAAAARSRSPSADRRACCRSARYLIHGSDAAFNLPERMTAQLRAALDEYGDVHEVGGVERSRCSSCCVKELLQAVVLCSAMSPTPQYLAERKRESDAKQDARFRKGSSRFRGVSWDTVQGKWRMRIHVAGKKRREYFQHEEHAARRYDRIQIELRGRWGAACRLPCLQHCRASNRPICHHPRPAPPLPTSPSPTTPMSWRHTRWRRQRAGRHRSQVRSGQTVLLSDGVCLPGSLTLFSTLQPSPWRHASPRHSSWHRWQQQAAAAFAALQM